MCEERWPFSNTEIEIGLQFVCSSFAESNNFSEGSSKPMKDILVNQVWGW